jgi:hypothetical protein
MEKGYSQISSAEEAKKEPKIGDYARGNVAERDPNGQTEKHEGIIVGEGENNKEWKVVDPGYDRNYLGDPIPPSYDVRNIHKEGAEVVPVPWYNKKHVEDIRKQLEKNT